MNEKEKALEELGRLPLSIFEYRDSRADDYDVDPYTAEKETTVAEKFTPRQVEILNELLTKLGFKPVSLRVFTHHAYYEFKHPSHRASVSVECREEDSFLKQIIGKSTTNEKDYYRYFHPVSWVEEKDLKA